MNRIGIFAGVILISWCIVGPAAADLVSPPLQNDPLGGLDTYVCSVLSTKPKPIDDVTIELVKLDGAVVASVGPVTVFPNDDRTLIWESGVTVAFCRVRGKLSKSKTLVTFCGAQSASSQCLTYVGAP